MCGFNSVHPLISFAGMCGFNSVHPLISFVGMCGFNSVHPLISFAGMAELADAPDLGSGIFRCAGSSPVTRTKFKEGGQNTPFFEFAMM